ncbi:double-strand break repair helicase AddA [Polymorphobacter fuscus]|nr:double-strand break repair helicase AddA [Polymorphobacter fuscus]NJC09348.1 ATP-dependent helicase/nuclease subunit A [Polymorphobacter fuscus]
MTRSRGLEALMPAQAAAANPHVHAWVAASAGTGKTQVLSARVLRLLLGGTPPAALLCLTFTKLAAAEMQTRVFDRLAWWARCDAAALDSDLAALGAATDAETRTRARRLFAQVLDAPQGLAIQTIHAFAQSLIASFPIEAGVSPGFTTLDDRSSTALQRRLLAEAIESATALGDEGFLDDLAAISIDQGEMRLAKVAARLAGHGNALGEALAGLPDAGIEPMLRRGFGLATDGDAASALASAMARFDAVGVARLAAAFAGSGGKTAVAAAARAHEWLAASDRAAAFDQLRGFFCTAKDELRAVSAVPAAVDKADPALRPLFARLGEAVLAILAEQRLHAAVVHAARHLRIGKRLAADWRTAKARLGVVDYDDMIAAAQRLLRAPGAAEWVRFKLDSRIDHVLVDEAQDTNASQWDIIGALIEEFFAGSGARDLRRTLFVVGDYKQSIFGFQGSDPRVYRDKRDELGQLAGDAGDPIDQIALDTNFRSVGAILEVVDATITVLGATTFDADGVPVHVPHRKPGQGAVTLWPPVRDDSGTSGNDDSDGADTTTPPRAETLLAYRIADTIAGWLDPRDPLVLPAHGRAVRPQDILVLVRSRGAFSPALVKALHANQVPVAGVDRLKLSDPLAVADLLALARFALQPGDDLTLAALLVSPFLGLDHDMLHRLAADRPGTLWDAVRGDDDPRVVAARDWLSKLLGFADFTAPHEFFERVLSGPLQGRKRLLARLGAEARDAIDAVLDQALAFEVANAPTLQGFLAWVDAEDIAIKRDPDAPLDAVRLMTVHGAKGLQAPVVILADATKARQRERDAPLLMSFDNGAPLPVFLATRKGLSGRLADAIEAEDEQNAREHCRLLYVALTRAEDLLFIGGTLGTGKTDAPEGSWYAAVGEALQALDAEVVAADGWDGDAIEWRSGTAAPCLRDAGPVIVPDDATSLPQWAVTAPPPEARPARPLSPSAIAADDVALPPMGAAARAAARRGQALHALFERLPALPHADRRRVGEAWCAAAHPDLDAAATTATVLAILDDPAFAAVFAPDALAEAPLAALVGYRVIAGTVDRLVVTGSDVLVVDFKTGARVPADAQAVPPYYLRQMAAYVAALRVVFPGRRVTAALLFTEGPRLIALPDALLALYPLKDEAVLNPADDVPIFPQ